MAERGNVVDVVWLLLCESAVKLSLIFSSLLLAKDMNDFSPMFGHMVYRGVVAPNAFKGTIVITVQAEDWDTPVSGLESLMSNP